MLDLAGGRASFREEFRKDFLGGVTILRHPALVYRRPLAGEPLYAPFAPARPRPVDKTELTFIPYCVIANREITPMTVWVAYGGYVHSAGGWEELLLPEVERQKKQGKQVVFRADAALAKPEL